MRSLSASVLQLLDQCVFLATALPAHHEFWTVQAEKDLFAPCGQDEVVVGCGKRYVIRS